MELRLANLLLASSALIISQQGQAQTSSSQNAPAQGAQGRSGTPESGPADIVVTAQRREQALARVPVSVSVLTSSELAKKMVTSQSDLQLAVPGLVTRQTNTQEFTLAIRGQSVDSSSESQPAVLTYVNEFAFGSVSQSNFFDLSSIQILKGPQGTLFGRNSTAGAVLLTTVQPDTKQVSGFGNLLLGSYAWKEARAAINLPLGQTVAIRVASDIDRRAGYVHNEVTGGRLNNDHRNAVRASLLWQPSSDFKSVTVAGYENSSTHGHAQEIYSANAPGSTGPSPDNLPLVATAATFYGPGLDAIAGPGAYAAIRAAYPGTPAGGLLDAVAQQRAAGPWKTYLDAATGGKAHSWYAMNTTSWNISDAFNVKNIIGVAKRAEHELDDADGSPFPIVASTAFRLSGWNASEELQFNGTVAGGKLKYIAGAFFSTQLKREGAQYQVFELGPVADPILAPAFGASSLPLPSQQQGKERYISEAIYGQGTYDLGDLVDGLSFTGGARYSWDQIKFTELAGYAPFYPPGIIEKQRDSEPSWQVSLQEQVNSNFLVYVVSRGSWRDGGFNGFAPPNPALASSGGNEFLPEKTHDVEVGAKFNGRLGAMPTRFNIALYNQWVSKLQRVAYVTLPTGLGALTYNIPGGAQFRGIELDSDIRPAQWLRLGGSFTRTSGKYGPGHSGTVFGTFLDFDTFADISKYSGSAFAEITIPLAPDVGELSVRGDFYAQSSSYFSNYGQSANPGAKIPGYHLVNFRVDWQKVLGTQITLSAFVKNAFDKPYYVGGTAQGAQIGLSSVNPGEPRMAGAQVNIPF